jgi:hypothetical protein
MSQNHTLTDQQSSAVCKIRDFITGSCTCFILKGSAGTGKTTLISQLLQQLDIAKHRYELLAPTGRAARILGSKTKTEASTIHSAIYHLTEINIVEDAISANDPGLRFTFPLKKSDVGNTLFIVDESSMVGDKVSHNDLLQFGSGRLLADLIEYAKLAGPENTPRTKILFVGDPAQLPPVGETFSPALSTSYLKENFGLECTEFELTEVMRQESGSGILNQATVLRNSINDKKFNTLNLTSNNEDIHAVSVIKAITLVEQAVKMKSSSVLITYSNAQALELNRSVRGRLWGDEQKEPQIGDLMLVNKNSTIGLYNGDLVKVRQADPNAEHKSVRIKGVDGPIELVFRNVSVAYRDMDGKIIEIGCKILENLLDSPERDLTPLLQRALLVDFRLRNPNLTPRSAEFKLAIQQDKYFNALQVKYGYALTCHKAQGGEWETVAINFGSGRGQRNENFFRWTYTAITRAKNNLVIINAPNFTETSSLTWGLTKPSVHPQTTNAAQQIVDPDWNRLSFNRGQEKLFAFHLSLREAWAKIGIAIEQLEHMNYRERYILNRRHCPAFVEYQYNGKGMISKVSPVPSKLSDQNVLADAMQAMEAILKQHFMTNAELTDPFLATFRDRIRNALDGSDINLISAQPMQYRLRILFELNGSQENIDFHYDSSPKWTKVEEVGGNGSSGGLFERLHQLLGSITE